MARGTTRTRKARPGLEPMEGRLLMDGALAAQFGETPDAIDPLGTAQVSGDASTAADTPLEGQASQTTPTPTPVKTLNYVTPRRVRVAVNLIGPGTLEGSRVREDGALELVYDGTGPDTQIVSHATGFAPLAFVKDADVPLQARAGSGANQVGLAGLRSFNLVDGGTVNFIGGVRKLQLNNVGRNTQVILRELPEVAEARAAAQAEAEAQAAAASRDLTFQRNPQGGVELVLTDGGFFPVFTTGTSQIPDEPPPGIRVQVNRIAADPVAGGMIGNPQIYGYDAVAGQLMRFDAVSGAVLQSIAVPSVADTAGVGLGAVGDRAVVLVGQVDLVRAYDAVDGTFVGSFTTSNMPEFDSIDGIGITDLRTVLIDTDAGEPGVARAISLTASLASGVAVPTTATFVPSREFQFFGGATGVAGFDPLTVLGSGFFDTQQPSTRILGFMNLNTVGDQLRELDRDAVPGNQTAPAPGSDEALGSVDQSVARVIGVENGQNVVSLVSRTTLARVGTTRLNAPNRLAGLSESFRPDLRGKAVFDIQGDVQAFLANDARGLVLDDLGTLYLLGIGRARDSYIAGFPINHVFLGSRRNVSLVTPVARPSGGRGGFTVIPDLLPIGPLFIP